MDVERQDYIAELRRLSAALRAARDEHAETVRRIETESAHEERRHEHEPRRHAGELARLAAKRESADRQLAEARAALDVAQRRQRTEAFA